jgi:ABC-type branched-subunit amino acid transport system ATPase component/ABC-type branched-subunit amino acid transport system permease subunit
MNWRAIVLSIAFTALAAAAIAHADGYQRYILALVGLTTIVGVGLNILLGLSGQISLGHVGFYAIGAYAVAILTVNHGWNFWPALLAAVIVSGAAGAALALPALRVRGPYLAMVTIAFGFVIEQVAAEWKEVTGGWNGMLNIPAPSAFGFEFSEKMTAFLILFFAVASLGFYAWLSRNTWGQAMRAIRDSEVAGQSIGFNPIAVRMAAFVLSAMMTGLAGGIFSSISGFISPESFPFFQSILFLLVVMIGGADRTLGPLFGAIVVVLLPEVLSFLAGYRLLFVGVLLLLVLRLAPDGIVGLTERLIRKASEGAAPRPAEAISTFLSRANTGNLTVRNLSITFGGIRAVTGLNFEAQPGKITSVIGPNGAGKTTVLNLVCGFYKPSSGTVAVGSREVAGKPSHAVAQSGIARTYQTTQLFGQMSVLDNIMIAFRKGRLFRRNADDRLAGADERRLAESLLSFVGYTGPVDRRAAALAHVDKRLVEIARALATRPSVLLLDEPAAGLSAADTKALGALMRQIAALNVAVILVEHDMELVMGISDRIVVLDAGSKIADGPPDSVRHNEQVLKAYLGEGTVKDRGRASALAPATKPVVAVKDLAASYGAVAALHGVDLTVNEGEFVCVLGANGAGKSTLMRALSGLHRPIRGEILLVGHRIEHFVAHHVAKQGLVLVPEGRQVFPELSVVDNIRLGGFSRVGAELEADVERMLTRFPRLRERAGQRAGLLSGGEQQMLAIARGLVARPKVLMLDEPSLGLAPALIENLYSILAELRDQGLTILLVDQMAGLALSVADRAYILQSGAVVQSGIASDFSKDPSLQKAYLGEVSNA